jgi:hypothetical protein
MRLEEYQFTKAISAFLFYSLPMSKQTRPKLIAISGPVEIRQGLFLPVNPCNSLALRVGFLSCRRWNDCIFVYMMLRIVGQFHDRRIYAAPIGYNKVIALLLDTKD